jgi:hypothetical protein
MGLGRLIRVRKRGENPQSVAYIVHEADSAKAVEIIRNIVGSIGDDIQDLGRVSEELLKAMSIGPGQFVPVDGVQHVSQQQQQPQPASKKQT